MEHEPLPATSYHLCARDGRFRWKHAEIMLTLSDEGIDYHLDGRAGLRRYTDLRSVRLQAMSTGQRSSWETILELTFARGLLLLVYSNASGGSNEVERDRAFVAFVEDLHRRIPAARRSEIRFVRGVPEGRHRVMIAALLVFLLVFGAAAVFVLGAGLSGRAPWLQVGALLAAVGGFGYWIVQAVSRNRPGTYDPARLPRELLPE